MKRFSKTWSYNEGLEWMNISATICNRLPEVDKTVIENLPKDVEGNGRKIYTWLITDADKSQVEFMQEHFDGYIFSYSNLLECYILCVDRDAIMFPDVRTNL